jgi:hypothetical protein
MTISNLAQPSLGSAETSALAHPSISVEVNDGSRTRRIVLRCIGVIIAFEMFFTGLWVREQVWQACTPIHYRGDLEGAHRHGNRIIAIAIESQPGATQTTVPPWSAVFQGYLRYYDQIIAENPDGRFNLDYPPLRLLVMSLWSRLVYVPGMAVEDYDINQCEPLLRLNTCSELLAAIAAFLLVRYWVTRGEPAGTKSERAWCCGLAAAVLIWFDPSLLLDAHGWPQWDAWVLPFYLFAAWAASTGRWFSAGVILAIGGAAKGQLWVAAPVLLLWPIFAWEWLGFLRIVVGAIVGLACIQSIWTFSIPSAGLWIFGCAAATSVAAGGNKWLLGRWRVGANAVAAGIVVCPWMTLHPDATLAGALVVAAAMLLLVWRIPRRQMAIPLCAIFAAAIFLASFHYDASFGWFKLGIVFGANRNESHMFAGISNNLPAILTMRYGWNSPDEIVTTLKIGGADDAVTLGVFLQGLYALSLVACAWGLAIHARRKSPHALLALAAPWILFYALMPQMHERYLLWGGVVSAIWVGVAAGPTLLHIVITLLSADTILHVMLDTNPDQAWPRLHELLEGMHPDSGWAVLLCAAICLYWAIVPERSRSSSRLGR